MEMAAAGKTSSQLHHKTPKVVRDADGNIVEQGLLDMLEQKGEKVTFDFLGNIVIV